MTRIKNSSSRPRWFAFAAIVACAVAFAGTAIAASVSSSGTHGTATATQIAAVPNLPAVKALSAEQSSLGIFRRAQTAGDALPAEATSRLAKGTTLGQNLSLARKALTTADGLGLFVVPANNAVCLDNEVGGGACTTVSDVNKGDFVTVDLCAPKLPAGMLRVSGIVPDGVDAVTVTDESGATSSVAVTGNAYSFNASQTGDLPTTISWVANDKTVTTPVGAPAGLPVKCAT